MSTQERFEASLRKHAHQAGVSLSVPPLGDVRAGLKLSMLKDLCVRLDLQTREVEATFGLSVRTLQRRHKDQAPLTHWGAKGFSRRPPLGLMQIPGPFLFTGIHGHSQPVFFGG